MSEFRAKTTARVSMTAPDGSALDYELVEGEALAVEDLTVVSHLQISGHVENTGEAIKGVLDDAGAADSVPTGKRRNTREG